MIVLGCGDGWLKCLKDAILGYIGKAIEGLISVIFQPILDAIGKAVGDLMGTIGTFWIFVDTPAVGDVTTGKPANNVDWVWTHTSFIAVFVATIGVIVAGAHMAWSQRGEAARDLLRSLLTLAVAATLSVAVVQVLVQLGDTFSKCMVATALDTGQNGWTCSLSKADPHAFGTAMATMMGFAAASTGPIGIGLMITIGILTVLASVIQIVLMVVRSAMLILLLGVLPIAAAATNTEMGRSWFKRIVSWLVAFVLYKPVAALVYATAIRLTAGDGSPLSFNGPAVGARVMNMVTGVTMLFLALFALPALMRFVTPMVAATAGAAGAGAIAGRMVGMDKVGDKFSESAKGESDGPSGARNVGRPSSSSSQGASPSGSQSSGPSPQPARGSGGAAGSGDGGASSGGASGGGVAGGEGAAAGGGVAGGGGAAASGGAAAAGGGAAAGGAAAGAGAAAGPVGVAVVAGALAVKKGVDTAKDAAQTGANETIDNDSMDEGPRGSG